MSEVVRTRAVITGRVQGVWFRASTEHMAARIGVAGWVRNLPDGSVEAVFEGEPARVDAAIDWCHTGPERAHVEHVAITAEEPEGLSAFSIR